MLFKRLKKYCHINSRLFCYSLLLMFFACENSVEKTVDSSDNSGQDLENTLNDNLTGVSGSVHDYFYNLDCEQIDAKYYRNRRFN